MVLSLCERAGKRQAIPGLQVSERSCNKSAFWKHLEESQVYQLSWVYGDYLGINVPLPTTKRQFVRIWVGLLSLAEYGAGIGWF